jgi:high frequency lysogenization protein
LLDVAPFEASINSLLQLDAESTEAVYGGLSGLKTGLQVLCAQLGTGSKRDMEVMHYMLGMVFLERKLAKHDGMLEKIKLGIDEAIKQTELYAMTDPNIIAQLAYLYTQTLSTLDYRIKVNGERRFLENQNNAHKIRALLLAGIRSAVLWRQKGGKRLHLIFSRGKILRSAQQSLEHLKTQTSSPFKNEV